MEHVYTLRSFLLDACVTDGCIRTSGGDFNACIGPLKNHEALDQIGQWEAIWARQAFDEI